MTYLGKKNLPTCPKCNGTKYYNNTPCNNCGGQYMFGEPTGFTRYNKLGVPCLHAYTITYSTSRGYHTYKCNYCSSEFHIDSGD